MDTLWNTVNALLYSLFNEEVLTVSRVLIYSDSSLRWTLVRTLHWATGPVGLLVDSWCTPEGVHQDSIRSPSGLQQESIRTPAGLQQDSSMTSNLVMRDLGLKLPKQIPSQDLNPGALYAYISRPPWHHNHSAIITWKYCPVRTIYTAIL